MATIATLISVDFCLWRKNSRNSRQHAFREIFALKTVDARCFHSTKNQMTFKDPTNYFQDVHMYASIFSYLNTHVCVCVCVCCVSNNCKQDLHLKFHAYVFVCICMCLQFARCYQLQQRAMNMPLRGVYDAHLPGDERNAICKIFCKLCCLSKVLFALQRQLTSWTRQRYLFRLQSAHWLLWYELVG